MNFSFRNLFFTFVLLCSFFFEFSALRFLCGYFAFLSAFYTFYAHAVHDERFVLSLSLSLSLAVYTLKFHMRKIQKLRTRKKTRAWKFAALFDIYINNIF